MSRVDPSLLKTHSTEGLMKPKVRAVRTEPSHCIRYSDADVCELPCRAGRSAL